jgi:beta-xylosidase
MNNSLRSRNTLKVFFFILALMTFVEPSTAQKNKAHDPLIFADVPDIPLMRVGENYYMSSTTTPVNAGVPMMKSTDLVNRKLINYSYDTLADLPALNLSEGKSIYSRGSWASSHRYYKGMISI